MKYDKQCAKQILEYIEAQDNLPVNGNKFNYAPIPFASLVQALAPFSAAEVAHNLICLSQMGYVIVEITDTAPTRITDIEFVTITGHKYLEEIS